MTIRTQFIADKIKNVQEYLVKAREIFKTMTDEEILNSELNLHTLERYLQLIVDAILDINVHLIKELDLETAKDFKSTFEILSDNSILQKEFSQKISGVVGLRNQVVHQYEKVDNARFLDDFRKHNSDFDEYFKQIIFYIDKNNF